jgi:ABC-type branched-subunit amino acid transport system substrate-binding protein
MASGYTKNVILADGFFAESKSPRVRNFVEKYEAAYQKPPGFIEAIAYDSAMIVMEALAFSDATDRGDLKDILLNMRDFPGVTGNTSFDATGDAVKDVYILRIKNDRFVELKPPGNHLRPYKVYRD